MIWFNGNGIPERYWIPETTGVGYDLSPCLAPILPVCGLHALLGLALQRVETGLQLGDPLARADQVVLEREDPLHVCARRT